ncbi:MAG: hypothetical protein H0U35_14620 [Sporichthyaceae bacterium]|nr:hypothetical protein [Sporichthyaceae bacterium]
MCSQAAEALAEVGEYGQDTTVIFVGVVDSQCSEWVVASPRADQPHHDVWVEGGPAGGDAA